MIQIVELNLNLDDAVKAGVDLGLCKPGFLDRLMSSNHWDGINENYPQNYIRAISRARQLANHNPLRFLQDDYPVTIYAVAKEGLYNYPHCPFSLEPIVRVGRRLIESVRSANGIIEFI